jgi:hypothetical protein
MTARFYFADDAPDAGKVRQKLAEIEVAQEMEAQ